MTRLQVIQFLSLFTAHTLAFIAKPNTYIVVTGSIQNSTLKTTTIKSVKECMDLCASTPTCVAAEMYAPAQCALKSRFEGADFGARSGFLGVRIGGGVGEVHGLCVSGETEGDDVVDEMVVGKEECLFKCTDSPWCLVATFVESSGESKGGCRLVTEKYDGYSVASSRCTLLIPGSTL